jgi:hypothetical protein
METDMHETQTGHLGDCAEIAALIEQSTALIRRRVVAGHGTRSRVTHQHLVDATAQLVWAQSTAHAECMRAAKVS